MQQLLEEAVFKQCCLSFSCGSNKAAGGYAKYRRFFPNEKAFCFFLLVFFSCVVLYISVQT